MKPIEFTQYLMPNGRKRQVTMEVDEAVEAIATELVADGVRFEAEMLSTGVVSLTAEKDDEDGETTVLAHEIIPNGPGMREAVERLIQAAKEAMS